MTAPDVTHTDEPDDLLTEQSKKQQTEHDFEAELLTKPNLLITQLTGKKVSQLTANDRTQEQAIYDDSITTTSQSNQEGKSQLTPTNCLILPRAHTGDAQTGALTYYRRAETAATQKL